MHLPLIAMPLPRDPQRVARANARSAALEARVRRAEREDVEVFLTRVLPAQRKAPEQPRAT